MKTKPATLSSSFSGTGFKGELPGALTLRLVGGFVAAAGLLVLVGWVAHLSWVVGAIPGAPTMKANTSLGFVLCGAAMLLLSARGRARAASPSTVPLLVSLARLATALAGSIAVLTLLEYGLGVNLGIDEFLCVDFLPPRDAYPGRMGVNSAICLALSSAALWVLGRPDAKKWSYTLVAWLSALVVCIAIDALVAHVEARSSGYNWLNMMSMAEHTAFLYVLLGFACLRVAAAATTFRWTIGPSLSLEFAFGLALFIAVAGLSHRSATQFGQETLKMKSTREVLEKIWALRAAVDELDAAAWASMIAGGGAGVGLRVEGDGSDEEGLRTLQAELAARVASDPVQLERLQQLQTTLDFWLEGWRKGVRLRKESGFEAARHFLQEGGGREGMERIDKLLSDMVAEERLRVAVHELGMHHVIERTFGLLPPGVLLSILVLSSGMVRLSREMDIREQTAKALKISESQLRLTLDAAQIGDWGLNLTTREVTRSPRYDQIFGCPEPFPAWTYGTFLEHVHPEDRAQVDRAFQESLAAGREWSAECRILRRGGGMGWIWLRGRCFKNDAGQVESMRGVLGDITERRAVEEEVRSLNATLEQRVRERTLKLESAVKELDAFSYSVSHDLRAPLRAIDGFSRIVIEEYSGRLDEEGRRKLGVIRIEAQRMGRLIDDLLTFSRLGRAEIRSESVDMTALAQDVFNELRELDGNGRRVDFKLQPLPCAVGAPAMIRQVWVNLLGNAIKFTRARAVAEIEVGAQQSAAGETAYYVKDNGVGFDMRHVGKLFGVFQRLHSDKEFEGTGVGLALVQRIVSRHGGRAWGEGEEGRGATFFFTLPNASV